MIYLLDTSAYTGFKRNDTVIVSTLLAAERIFFSPIVMGELVFGFRHGSRFRRNMEDLDLFLDEPVVELLPVGRTAADRYARVAATLKAKGTPVPTNDIWIAAQTIASGAELLTYDRRFEMIDGLILTLLRTAWQSDL